MIGLQLELIAKNYQYFQLIIRYQLFVNIFKKYDFRIMEQKRCVPILWVAGSGGTKTQGSG